MERRSFLKGVLTSVTAGTALVRLATPGEATSLVADRDVLIGQPNVRPVNFGLTGLLGRDIFMYNDVGEMFPAGYLTEIEVSNDPDKFEWGGTIHLAPGITRATGRFVGRTTIRASSSVGNSSRTHWIK